MSPSPEDGRLYRWISGDPNDASIGRTPRSLQEMLALVEGGTRDERLDLALTDDLPRNISARLLEDDDLGVVAAVLWTNRFTGEQPVHCESRLRAMPRSEDVDTVLLRLGEQPQSRIASKLDVRFNHLPWESIQDALDGIGVTAAERTRVLGTWRKNPKRELWTFREVLTDVGVEVGA